MTNALLRVDHTRRVVTYLFPEDLEGQTVIDLSSQRAEGFSSPDDPFIWSRVSSFSG